MQKIACGACCRRFLSLSVLLSLALLAVPALAQKADRPEIKVGDRWVFQTLLGSAGVRSSDIAWVVTSVTPTRIEGTENGHPLVLTPDLNIVQATQVKYSNLRLLSFPLEIGKSWTFTNDSTFEGPGVELQSRCDVVVVGYEKVRVPAGEFDAFKLEAKSDWVTGGYTGKSTWTYWYAPVARAVVKQEYWTSFQQQGLMTTELAELHLQP